MSQPVTVRRYYIVKSEHSRLTGDGYHQSKKDEVEAEARKRGCLVAVTSSCGYGWNEERRYDPADDGEGDR